MINLRVMSHEAPDRAASAGPLPRPAAAAADADRRPTLMQPCRCSLCHCPFPYTFPYPCRFRCFGIFATDVPVDAEVGPVDMQACRRRRSHSCIGVAFPSSAWRMMTRCCAACRDVKQYCFCGSPPTSHKWVSWRIWADREMGKACKIPTEVRLMVSCWTWKISGVVDHPPTLR